MGMYTEIVVVANVKNDPAVIEVLKSLGSGGLMAQQKPDHPFFQTDRHNMIFTCCSYYFTPATTFKLDFDKISDTWSLISRADLKNYDNEVEKFFDWIRPHLEADSDTMIGYSRYEEDREPVIYYGSD